MHMETGIGNCLLAFLASTTRCSAEVTPPQTELVEWTHELARGPDSANPPLTIRPDLRLPQYAATFNSPGSSILSDNPPLMTFKGPHKRTYLDVCERRTPTGVPSLDSPVSSGDGGARISESDLGQTGHAMGSAGFKCRYCHAYFTAKFNLNKHVRALHERKRPYHCEECGSSFQQKDHLTCHKKTVHEKLKPYQCDVCGKKFGWSGVLKKHVRIVHEKERPYPCVHCGHAFRQKAHLEKHVTTIHEKRRPYSCDMCGSAFGRKDVLVRHVRTMHSPEKMRQA